MVTSYTFGELLDDYLEDAGFSPGVMSQLSGVPRKTIQHWINGHVKRPNTPKDLLAIAQSLHLTAHQTDSLLRAAGHSVLAELARLTSDPQVRHLLMFWPESHAQVSPPPFQAIADLPTIVGREAEIQSLARFLRRRDQSSICCLSGMGGVGKTVLAAHLAYRLRPHFPDGVLWARVDVTAPLAILGAFAHAFDHDVSHTRDLYARSQVVRSILANKRVLIIFDNVRQRAEIEPLLPPSGGCRVLITTRHHDLLIGIAGHRVVIEPFAADGGGAQALFADVLGVERASREREALAEIAQLVGQLPLALAISASRLAYEPGWTAAAFAARLRAEQGRLARLEFDNRSVRGTLTLSYATLTLLQQRCLMAISVCAGADVGIDALAAIMDLPSETTLDVVRTLYGLSLVQQGREEHYRTHLLVKAYVLEQGIDPMLWWAMARYFITSIEGYQQRYTIIDGVFDHLLGAFEAALRYDLKALYVRGVITCSPYLRDRGHHDFAAAQLQRAAMIAQETGAYEERLYLFREQGRLAEQGGDRGQEEVVWRAGLAFAREYGDAAWVAAMLIPLGNIAGHADRVAERDACWDEALTTIALLDDHLRASELLRQLGLHTVNIGDFQLAVRYWNEALDLARKAGDVVQVCRLLTHLNSAFRDQGDWNTAEAYAREGLRLAQEQQRDWLSGLLFGDLAIIASLQGDFVQANAYLVQALLLARASGQRIITADIFVTQSMIARQQGDYVSAERSLREAERLISRLRPAWFICEISYEWGELNLAYHRWEAAATAFTQAWEIAHERRFLLYSARIAYGQSRLAAAQGLYAEARRWGEESLRWHQIMKHYQTSEVAEWLSSLAVN